MADEFYREEIIFDVNDADAIRRVNNAEKRIKKSLKRTKRQAEALNRVKAAPVIKVKDRMSKQVTKADKLIKKLGKKKAAPIITAKDKMTGVMKKTDKLINKMNKKDVKVTATMKGKLLKDIEKAKATISKIDAKRFSAEGRLKGNMIKELKRSERMLRKLGSTRAHPVVTIKDRATMVLKRIHSGLRKVASKSWELVIAAKNKTFAVFRGIRNQLTSLQGMATIVISVVGLSKLNQATTGAAMKFEEYEVAMNHWLNGNKKKSKELIDWMGKFADSTPFNSDDLFPALTRGVGISDTVGQAKDLLKISADMAALTPGKTVQDAMEALADAQMGEFERMKEFQVKMTKEQYDAIGGWGGFIDLVQKRVKGGAEKLSDTATGMISTIVGYTKSMFRSLGVGILESMKPRLIAIRTWIENNQETLGRWKDTLTEWGKQGAEVFFQTFETMFKKIDALFENPDFQKADFFGKIKIAWGELVAEPFSDWYNSEGKTLIQDTSNKIGKNIGEFIGAGLMGLFGAGGSGGSDFTNAGATGAKAFLDGFAENFDLVKVIKAGAKSLYNLNKSAFEGPGNFIAAMLADIILAGLALKLGKGIKNLGKLMGGGLLLKGGKKVLDKRKNKGGPVVAGSKGKKKKRKNGGGPRGGGGAVVTGSKKRKGKTKTSTAKKPKFKLPKIPALPSLFKLPKKLPKLKLPKKLPGSGLLKKIPFLGSALTAAEVAGAKGAKAKSSAAGGGVGMIAGGALGSLLGPLGTLGGGVLGDTVGRKVGAVVPEVAETVGNAVKTGFGKVKNWLGFGGKEEKKTSSVSTNTPTGQGVGIDALTQKTQLATNNMQVLTSWLGKASGWVAGAFHPLSESGGNLSHNTTALSTWLGKSSAWVASAFSPLGQSTLSHNMSALSTWTGQASGWVVGAFQPLSQSGAALHQNVFALTTWLGQSSGWVVGAFYPLSTNGAALNHNVVSLSSWLGQASGWVVAAFYPMQAKGAMVVNNTAILAGWVGQASGWVASLYGIQEKAAAVKNALSGLASRIRNTRTPTMPSIGGGPLRAYANGGMINRPHLGLVGEAGPEAIIPLSSNRRNRAMELYEKTGRALGVRQYADGGVPKAPEYKAPPEKRVSTVGGGKYDFHVSTEGMIGQVVIRKSEEEIDEIAERAGEEVAKKVKAILDNLS
ncbi:hypothetical protein GLV94_05335 [Virgibacillus halodenitrificans]|uniref:hypothetical protein n=1 Tax=Virgibacillus halodenitrificans TaxID=1482 RepID=UPI00136B7CBF|nr:hypothetical protein [Virgibacillus halodenitrificans]MYL45058.1 hypothetical protein [Virgibacillus halodenitrificans]